MSANLIRQLLSELNTASDGAIDKRQLAKRLSVTPQILETMLEALSTKGYVEELEWPTAEYQRPANCQECPISAACAGNSGSSAGSGSAQPLWRITDRGRRVVQDRCIVEDPE